MVHAGENVVEHIDATAQVKQDKVKHPCALSPRHLACMSQHPLTYPALSIQHLFSYPTTHVVALLPARKMVMPGCTPPPRIGEGDSASIYR